mgnify:CR=1 FL=1
MTKRPNSRIQDWTVAQSDEEFDAHIAAGLKKSTWERLQTAWELWEIAACVARDTPAYAAVVGAALASTPAKAFEIAQAFDRRKRRHGEFSREEARGYKNVPFHDRLHRLEDLQVFSRLVHKSVAEPIQIGRAHV